MESSRFTSALAPEKKFWQPIKSQKQEQKYINLASFRDFPSINGVILQKQEHNTSVEKPQTLADKLRIKIACSDEEMRNKMKITQEEEKPMTIIKVGHPFANKIREKKNKDYNFEVSIADYDDNYMYQMSKKHTPYPIHDEIVEKYKEEEDEEKKELDLEYTN